MNWPLVAAIAGAACFVLGSLLAFTAGLGVFRYRDLLTRMHPASKPQVLGLVLSMIGLTLLVGAPQIGWQLLLVVALQFLTIPVASHLVARAGYRTGATRRAQLSRDDLTEDLRGAARTSLLGPTRTRGATTSPPGQPAAEPGPAEPGSATSAAAEPTAARSTSVEPGPEPSS